MTSPASDTSHGATPAVVAGVVRTVTPNLAWDLTYRVDTLHPGGSHRVREVAGRAGGKGVNVARVLHHLGVPASVLASADGAVGADCAADLVRAGIPATLVPGGGGTRRCVTVVPDHPGADGGHPTVLNEPGAPVPPEVWARLVAAARTPVADDGSTPVSLVTVSGSLPPGVDERGLLALLDLGPLLGRTLVDVSGPAVLWAAGAGVGLLKPNRAELAEAVGTDDVRAGAEALRTLGAHAVVVTDGADGLVAFGADLPPAGLRARLRRAVHGNPTGAGDAALAGLAARWDLPWPDRLRYAVAVSAAAVAEPVAGDVDLARVATLADDVEVQPDDATP